MRRIFTLSGSFLFCIVLGVGLAAGQKSGDASKGKAFVDQQGCAACHSLDSQEKKMGPPLQGLFKRKTMQNGKPMNDVNVIGQVVNGGGNMPPYGDSLKSASDKADLLAYLHTL